MIAQPDREQTRVPTDAAAPLSADRLVALSVVGILVGLAVTAAVVALARRLGRRAGGPARERPGGA